MGLTLTMAACGAPEQVFETVERSASLGALPPMKTTTAYPVVTPHRSNMSIAKDFLDLTYSLENGTTINTLSRFETSITVRIQGRAPYSMGPDLGAFLGRLRSEAGIDISLTSGNANITVELVPRKAFDRYAANAACFVKPRVSSWREFQKYAGTDHLRFSTLTERDKMAVFIPEDVSPQEIRTCLHEELAQAIGPLNDLYRLTQSVFNDDDTHVVLTGFDMLILRAYYDPEMRSGLTRAEAAQRIMSVLARINPMGQTITTSDHLTDETPTVWKNALEGAIGNGLSLNERHRNAKRAVTIANESGWTDARAALSYYQLGRMSFAVDPTAAKRAFDQAEALYAALPDTTLQLARIDLQRAALALIEGDYARVIEISGHRLPTFLKAANAVSTAEMLMMTSEAHAALGNTKESQQARLDSLGWARYGMGTNDEIARRLGQISALRTAY